MHLRMEFQSLRQIVLPVQYNHILQGFIYKTIDEKLADFLHEKGYGKKRVFKMFCFSRLIGKYDNRSKPNHIIFPDNVFLEISSPMDDFCESFADGLLKKRLNIAENELDVVGITIEHQRVRSGSTILEALSPIVVYSTLTKGDGCKYTCYFQPGEKEFEKIAVENLKKKYEALSGMYVTEDVHIHCVCQPRISILEYKGTVINELILNAIIKKAVFQFLIGNLQTRLICLTSMLSFRFNSL